MVVEAYQRVIKAEQAAESHFGKTGSAASRILFNAANRTL